MTSPADPLLSAAQDQLRRRLLVAGRSSVPTIPAIWWLQRGGLDAIVEQHFCNESLALALDEAELPPRSLLVVDLSGTGRGAAVWAGRALALLAEHDPAPAVTVALPATRWAGRGQLIERHLEQAAAMAGLTPEVLSGPASAKRSAPKDDERRLVREAFDLIVVLCLGGAAGLDAPWPAHPARPWLELADLAVLSFVDPDSLPGDLPRLTAPPAPPARLRIELLRDAEADLVGELELDDSEETRLQLPLLIETARRHPWRAVITPPDEQPGTALSCPGDTGARAAVTPMHARRVVIAGRTRLVAAQAAH